MIAAGIPCYPVEKVEKESKPLQLEVYHPYGSEWVKAESVKTAKAFLIEEGATHFEWNPTRTFAYRSKDEADEFGTESAIAAIYTQEQYDTHMAGIAEYCPKEGAN